MNTSEQNLHRVFIVGLIALVMAIYLDCIRAAGFQITPTVNGTSRTTENSEENAAASSRDS